MNAMLSEALQDFTGLLKQLLTNLLGNDADTWGTEFKKFLRKEPCWTNGDAKSVTPTESKPKPAPLPMSVIVDCDANPIIRSGLSLTGEGTEHRRMGKITLEKREDGKLYANGKEVVRYLSPNQQNDKTIQGHKLRKELKDVQVLNACIMDALLANPQLIPDEWKSGYTYFWGTTFRSAGGDLCVGCLCWGGGQWRWGCSWLDSGWGSDRPAAVLAS
jgi:hypothetical protein